MIKRMPQMNAGPRHTRGFNLVEVLVASALGMIVALAVTTAIVSSGRQFTLIGATSAAQSSAQIALSLIDTAGRNAGAGFFASGQTLCPTWNAYKGSGTVLAANNAPFMSARIVDGGTDKTSDRIIFTGAAGNAALTAIPVMADGSVTFTVSAVGQFAPGDYAVIGAPGSGVPCTLFQITAVPAQTGACGGASACQPLTAAAGTGLNPPAATAFGTRPTYGYLGGGSVAGPATVSRVGSVTAGFRQDAFAVQCQALVRYDAFALTDSPDAALPACTQSPLSFGAGVDAIGMDIVQMHAQYGVSASATSDVVTAWVDAKTVGTTTWDTPTTALVARIKAVRVVVVARSREPDGATVTTTCTNGGGVVNNGPCSFDDASAPKIDLSEIDTPAGRTWQNYRYRAHTAVIPLRTVIWSD